jgi:5-methylcytosine-specific restriction endonuclease McrA
MSKKVKKAAKKAPKPPKVPKTRNCGTMTESGFWGFIRSSLRQKSRWWKPILGCKILSRRKSQSNNKRLKWEYQCNKCKNWFPEKEVSVDHIKPVGTLKSAQDLPFFVENLFCEIDNLQTLCDQCHTLKTQSDKIK